VSLIQKAELLVVIYTIVSRKFPHGYTRVVIVCQAETFRTDRTTLSMTSLLDDVLLDLLKEKTIIHNDDNNHSSLLSLWNLVIL
jgi:hypothetical protein